MMPLFFNLESHLWIAYLFIFNGLLLSLLLRLASPAFATLTEPIESLIVFSFVLSISLNGLILLALDYFNLEFSTAFWALVSVSAFAAFALYCFAGKQQSLGFIDVEWSCPRLFLYLVVFIILFYNGGMIDQLSDAWWHMSLTNKIAMANSYTPELGHLTSAPARYYPPLWHGNLALAHILSSESIPVFWNSFTAWGAVLKVMAFYCLAFGLTQSKKTAFISAVLFVLLPGIGNSYLRVSAWPSHIAYIVWYFMLFVSFTIIHGLANEESKLSKQPFFKIIADSVKQHRLNIAILIVSSVVVYYTHQTELLWFCVAFFAYFAAVSISRVLANNHDFIASRDHAVLKLAYRLMLATLLLIALNYVLKHFEVLSLDQSIAALLPLLILIILFMVELKGISRSFKIWLISFISLAILASVNGIHFLSLFFEGMSVPRGAFHESPSSVAGYFGGALDLPGWHLQLRSGLLYSGILALPLSLILVVVKPSPTTLFLSATALVSIVFCVSPYLYHWLKDILSYHSPWRITLMIFHPLIIAVCLVELLSYINRDQSNA